MSFKNILKKHNDLPQAQKVLFVPVNTRHNGMPQGFVNNGFQTYSINIDNPRLDRNKYKVEGGIKEIGELLIETCKNLQPNWVHIPTSKPGLIELKDVKEAKKVCGAIFTSWAGDVREEPLPFFIELSEIIDFTFISNVGQLDLYRKNGCKNVDYWQYGVDVNKAKPLSTKEKDVLKSKYNHDIVFCANSYDGFPGYYIRKSIVSEVYKKYGSRFAIYGNGWDTIAKNSSKPNIKYFEQNNVYNSSKIVLSINNFNDIEMYFSGRQLLAMASGTLTLSHYIPGLERYFENGKDLVWFKTEDECMKLIDYYLNNEGEAKRIGLNGSAKVLKEHSYEARIKELGIKLGFINE